MSGRGGARGKLPPRRTKLHATLGPASSSPDMVRALVAAGADGFRLNFSHTEHAAAERLIGLIREASREAGRPVTIRQDLRGPKLRVGNLAGGEALLREGETFSLTAEETLGDGRAASLSEPAVLRDLRPGEPVLLDDGAIRLRVEAVSGGEARCRVETGGRLLSRKGVNLPGSEVRLPSFTEKDASDLELGLRLGVDMVSLSFVRAPEDLEPLRRFLRERGGELPVVAKLETRAGVQNLDGLLAAAEGVSISRGDLGVECPPEEVPLIQRVAVARARARGKFVMVAAQCLHSMMESPVPTRAEVADVMGAVFDGVDAISLSGETAVGRHPLEAFQMLDRIVRRGEEALGYLPPEKGELFPGWSEEVRACVPGRASDPFPGSDALVVLDSPGAAFAASKLRPPQPIFFVTERRERAQWAASWWGVVPLLGRAEDAPAARALLRERGYLAGGESITILDGPAADL